MGLKEIFSFNGMLSPKSTEIEVKWPAPIAALAFMDCDVVTIYSRILTDVIERTHGMSDDQNAMLWDNCLGSEVGDGLVTMLAKAMANQQDLFIVYDKSVKVIRRANNFEQIKIRADYVDNGESSEGIYITFRNFDRARMVRLYSNLDYLTIISLWKSMNVSKAVQFKISDLRASIGEQDSDLAIDQAKAMAEGLTHGRDVLMDAKDEIVSATPDLTATTTAIDFISRKQSFYLGLPASWITGLQKGGMGDTGVADLRAIERGLKSYYFSVIKPVIELIFNIKTTFKSDDTSQVSIGLEALKTFDVTSNDHMSAENKTLSINRIFGLPEDAKPDVEEEAIIGGGEDVQKLALNGAQVTSLIAIVQAVATRQIPRESGVSMIVTSFNIERADAERLVGTTGASFFAEVEPQALPAPSAAPAT